MNLQVDDLDNEEVEGSTETLMTTVSHGLVEFGAENTLSPFMAKTMSGDFMTTSVAKLII
jgi:hypothetical protein